VREGTAGVPGAEFVTVKASEEVVVYWRVASEIFPLVVTFGTVATISLSSWTSNFVSKPSNKTWVTSEKFVPAMLTVLPAGPCSGEKFPITGGNPGTVKFAAEVIRPLAVTMEIFPEIAPAGTVTAI
jgi:hypothetical protein